MVLRSHVSASICFCSYPKDASCYDIAGLHSLYISDVSLNRYKLVLYL